jgi:hypothetical protein
MNCDIRHSTMGSYNSSLIIIFVSRTESYSFIKKMLVFFFWPLYCLSFLASDYPVGIFQLFLWNIDGGAWFSITIMAWCLVWITIKYCTVTIFIFPVFRFYEIYVFRNVKINTMQLIIVFLMKESNWLIWLVPLHCIMRKSITHYFVCNKSIILFCVLVLRLCLYWYCFHIWITRLFQYLCWLEYAMFVSSFTFVLLHRRVH